MIPEYAARYGSIEQWHWWFRGRQRIIEDVLRCELAGAGPLRICAVGCGPATGLHWLVAFAGPGGRVFGVDADPIHARDMPEGVEYLVGHVECAPVASHSIDLVIAMDVLEHVPDDAAALREAARMLKPGGRLLVTVPALPSLWGAQDLVNKHLRRYTRATLRAAFARGGLPAPRLTYFNTLLFPAIAAARWGRRALGLGDRLRTDFDDNRPGLVNEALMSVFASERLLIRRWSLPIGVSLLAMVRVG